MKKLINVVQLEINTKPLDDQNIARPILPIKIATYKTYGF